MTGNELTRRVVEILPQMVTRVDQAIAGLSEDQLNQPVIEGEWSILQVVEHMRLSHGSYLDLVPAAIAKVGHGDAEVKLTWVGNFLVREAGPGGNAPAPKPFRPTVSRYSASTLEEWRQQTAQLTEAFKATQGKDLNRKSLRNPVVPIFRMNLADVLSIAEGHFERHVRQIEERAAALRTPR